MPRFQARFGHDRDYSMKYAGILPWCIIRGGGGGAVGGGGACQIGRVLPYRLGPLRDSPIRTPQCIPRGIISFNCQSTTRLPPSLLLSPPSFLYIPIHQRLCHMSAGQYLTVYMALKWFCHHCHYIYTFMCITFPGH